MTKLLTSFEIQLCDIQGRLFELAIQKGYDGKDFISKFMCSQTAIFLDLPYDRLQWAGEEYILENLLDENSVLRETQNHFSLEEAYWTGYTYRYWHLLTGESSQEIYRQANAVTMQKCYLGFHTLDVAMAIDDLKELYHQEQNEPLH